MVPEISAQASYEALRSNPDAVLLDVRTAPELNFVGTPSLENCTRISYTLFPPTQPDPDFMEKVEAALRKDQPIYCLCKLGGRSQAAAAALKAAGFMSVFSIKHGFDGDQNDAGQRRSINGWVADGLPWHQA